MLMTTAAGVDSYYWRSLTWFFPSYNESWFIESVHRESFARDSTWICSKARPRYTCGLLVSSSIVVSSDGTKSYILPESSGVLVTLAFGKVHTAFRVSHRHFCDNNSDLRWLICDYCLTLSLSARFTHARGGLLDEW